MARSSRPNGKSGRFNEHVWYYLAVLEWHVSYGGPTFETREVPWHDWKTNTDKIAHEDELVHEDSLSLDLILEPYRQTMTVSKREIKRLEFQVSSSAEANGGLIQTGYEGDLRGWLFLPFRGVEVLLAVLATGRRVVLEIHGSNFWRGTALVRSNSGWATVGTPSLEDEFA